MDPIAIIAGIGTILGGVIGAGMAKKWVWGWTYAALEKALADMTLDRDFWRDTSLELLGHAKALEGGFKGKKK